MSGEVEADLGISVLGLHLCRIRGRRESASVFEKANLLGVGLLRRTEDLLGGESVRVGVVDEGASDFGMACDHREGFVNLTELIGDDHAHMSIDLLGAAFGMEGDEIERRTGFTRGSVLALETVIEKGLQKSRRPCHRRGLDSQPWLLEWRDTRHGWRNRAA